MVCSLHEEIDRLPERLRVLVVLCHLEGQSQELAAKTLSLPIGTVKSRLHRARDLLRGRLSRAGSRSRAALLSAEPASRAADAAPVLCRCTSPWFARQPGPASIEPATSGLISTRAIHLFEETIKTMFLTKTENRRRARTPGRLPRRRRGRRVRPAGSRPGHGEDSLRRAHPRQERRRPDPERLPPMRHRARVHSPVAHHDRSSASSAELKQAEERLDLTTANVRSPNDPEVVRARKTVETLAGLLARVDAVLVEAVDEFPTIFDFDPTPNRRRRAATRRQTGRRRKPEDPPAEPVIRRTLPCTGRREAGMVRQDARKRLRQQGPARRVTRRTTKLSRLASTPISPRQQNELIGPSGCSRRATSSKSQYDVAILKHYDALKARAGARRQGSRRRSPTSYLKV